MFMVGYGVHSVLSFGLSMKSKATTRAISLKSKMKLYIVTNQESPVCEASSALFDGTAMLWQLSTENWLM